MSDGTMQALLAELVHLRRRVERLETIENLNMAQVAAEYVPTLADQGQATVLGRASGAGTGAPSALTAAQLVAVVATADGTGSGLDADTVDGSHASSFAASSHTHGTSGIDDAAVTMAKLANQAQATVIGRAAAAGTGVPVALTAAQLITILTGADGTGSLLDADMLDGYQASELPKLATDNVFSGKLQATKVEIDNTSNVIDIDSAGALSMIGAVQSIADSATLSLPSFIGFLLVIDATNGNIGAFSLRGGVNLTQEVFDPTGIFSITKDTASNFNVYYDAGYKIQNKRGATKNISLFRLGG